MDTWIEKQIRAYIHLLKADDTGFIEENMEVMDHYINSYKLPDIHVF